MLSAALIVLLALTYFLSWIRLLIMVSKRLELWLTKKTRRISIAEIVRHKWEVIPRSIALQENVSICTCMNRGWGNHNIPPSS